MTRSRLIRRALRDRFVITLADGDTFEGILLSADSRHLVLTDAAPVNADGPRQIVDGELWLPADRVRYMQRPAGGR